MMFYWKKLTIENDFKYILQGIQDFEKKFCLMEIFAFKVGVGPNGPQQYLLRSNKNLKLFGFGRFYASIAKNSGTNIELFVFCKYSK